MAGFVNFKPLTKCNMEELAADQGGIPFFEAARNQKDAAREQILQLFSGENWPGRLTPSDYAWCSVAV